MSDEIYTPPSGPPQGPGPSPAILAAMGMENLFRLCADFYVELEKSELRPMFPENMPESSRKTAEFLIGLMGGPKLYIQKHGHPRMRARHTPFAIDERARQIWLGCFKKVLEQAPERYQFPKNEIPAFVRFLEEFSAWMVNRA